MPSSAKQPGGPRSSGLFRRGGDQATKTAKTPKPPKKDGRIKQMRTVYTITKKTDPRIGLILLGVFLLTAAVAFALLVLVLPGPWVLSLLSAIMLGVLAALIVFGRRAQKAQYAELEGRPGAAAAVLGQLRRGWKLDPGIAFNRQQDLVHRVVGPPGIVLVGEGNSQRLKTLLANERRKHERVTSETPIFEVVSGQAEGAVPIPKLTRHVTKLGRNIRPAEMTDVLQRLKALDANRSNIPIPKGPMPANLKGARQNMRGR